jgi:hypothetical protein
MNRLIDKITLCSSFLCLILVVYAITNKDKKFSKLVKMLYSNNTTNQVGVKKNE